MEHFSNKLFYRRQLLKCDAFFSQVSWKEILGGYCAGISCAWGHSGENLLWATPLHRDSTTNEECCECGCLLSHLGEGCPEEGNLPGDRTSTGANSFAAATEESEGLWYLTTCDYGIQLFFISENCTPGRFVQTHTSEWYLRSYCGYFSSPWLHPSAFTNN